LIRGLVLVVVLFATSALGAIAAPTAGAAAHDQGSHSADGAVTVQPEDPSAELGTPMVNVSDRRGSERTGTTVTLLAANAMMLCAGAVLLWRRCVITDPEVSP
jgi:hypothetical protein